MRLALPNIQLPRWLLSATRRASLLAGACAYLGGMALLCGFAAVSSDLPDASRLWEQNRPPSIQFVDRQGRDLAVRGAHAQAAIPVSQLPAHLRQAVLATEDRRFYAHSGVDPYGIARAMVTNLRAGRLVQGGSTLTQQLTKNVFLTPEQTLRRKVQEMVMSVWLERQFTKDELLRLYLSRVYFGGGAWGIEAASDTYFGRPPTELTLPESAMLAGLLKAPSGYYPVERPERAARRMRTVLSLMEAQGLLGDGVYQTALTQTVAVNRPASRNPAEYYIDWVWADIEARVGVPTQDMVIQLGVDAELQRAAHLAVNAHLDPDANATQGAVVLLDETGAVLAMVGGRDHAESQFNRAVQANRQPGSSFKPVVYLAALRSGLTPWTERVDQPITVDGWTPENFSEDFAGRLRLEEALARSINTVAVSVSEEIGRDAVVATAAQLGLGDMRPLPSLALGAQGASVIDMAHAYQPFASGGYSTEPFGLISIATATGTPLYQRMTSPDIPVLSPDELRLMNRMLVRSVERGTGRRARVAGRTVAGKTGTTNDNRDAWFVGYAPGLSAAVWVGDDDNAPMDRITGGTIPAMIFSDVMTAALADRPVAQIPQASEPSWAREQSEFTALLNRLEQAASGGTLP